MRLGLDISTTRIGFAVLDDEENILYSKDYKMDSSFSLEQRASMVYDKLLEIKTLYPKINQIYVEEPIILYKGGAGQAKTVAILQRFNGMVCYATYNLWGIQPFMCNAVSSRSRLGIKIVKKRGSKPRERKQPIIDFIQERYQNTKTPFIYDLTPKGNYKPGTDDRIDAIVVALAGPILMKEASKKLTKK